MEDKRFAHIANDPKFRRIPKNERKVKIDKRFQSMFKDKQFKVKYTIDKRGRPVSHTSTEDLKRYYDISSESSSESETENEESEEAPEESQEVGKFVKASGSYEGDEDNNELQQKHKSDKKLPDEVKKKLQNLNVDYARGEAVLYSESSSDDEESEDEVSEDDEIDHQWGELDADAEQTEEPTYRLAACNMDWDRIRARMQEEEVKGPIELVESKAEDNENENEEGSSYHMEKLRQYQLNRLKYYYAVITFDSANSANKIYTECDGMEYESSATKIDLRFIPDDMDFDEAPKELCDKLPEVNKYQPRFFTTTALQQAKVNLTWDETNPERLEIAEKLKSGKVDDISEADLQNYLASSSDEEIENQDSEESESEHVGDNPIAKYKSLLQDIEKKEKSKSNKDVEMEISWGIDLKEKTDKLMKKKLSEREQKTPFEQYLEKKKEKRKEKHINMNDPYFAEEFNKPEFENKKNREGTESVEEDADLQKEAELELLLMNEDDGKEHFSLKKIQQNEKDSKSKKKKTKKNVDGDTQDDNFQINIQDNRFSAIFSSHHFNIDPTDPHFKKTKGMEALIGEKLKRRNNSQSEETSTKIPKMNDPELSLLVKSVKRKANTFKNK
ncbi:hypothetical protein NQ318_014499 [Aromia moschata]|uniref:NUC153 domain-containing protein n=1 Tax=Aromia moschata TaxID=1265417 RepID=A0AAV8YMB8_9CUCU|nr:hypothetical protein NQ318_014499 [Aromia moschata]